MICGTRAPTLQRLSATRHNLTKQRSRARTDIDYTLIQFDPQSHGSGMGVKKLLDYANLLATLARFRNLAEQPQRTDNPDKMGGNRMRIGQDDKDV